MSYKQQYIYVILLASFSSIITAELSSTEFEPSMPAYAPIIQNTFFINRTTFSNIKIGSTGFTINFSDPVHTNNSTTGSIQDALKAGHVMIAVAGKFKDWINNGRHVLRRAHNMTNPYDMETIGTIIFKQIQYQGKTKIACIPLKPEDHKSFLETLSKLNPCDSPQKRFLNISNWYKQQLKN